MQVIIPLAGFGTRLRPHTYTKPKPLINVAGKAVLGHILDKFAGLDVEEFIIVHGYLGEQIQDYMARQYPQYHAQFVEQKELIGQADAILRCQPYVSGPVLIVFVDTLFEADLSGLANETADAVAFVKEVDDPRRFGVVKMDGQYITRFVEKPTEFISNQAVGGVYYLKDSKQLFAAIDEQVERDIQLKHEYFLADALQIMINHGAKLGTRLLNSWYDCGTAQSLLDSNRYLLKKTIQISANLSGSAIIPPVNIAPSAKLINSIIGPHVSVGENVVVSDSRIGPFVSIGDSSTVTRSIIEDSILNQHSQIEDAMLTNSLVGNQAHVKGKFDRLIVGDTSEVDSSYNHS
jgi:glucose-1-phosphate thymidylyltransferase